jgi:hypothetical protein
MNVGAFLERLAQSVNAVVPPGFEVEADQIRYRFAHLNEQRLSSAESATVSGDMLLASIDVLDDVQDDVCERTREPWPNKGIAEVPTVKGMLVATGIELWLEDSSGHVLKLPPVALD